MNIFDLFCELLGYDFENVTEDESEDVNGKLGKVTEIYGAAVEMDENGIVSFDTIPTELTYEFDPFAGEKTPEVSFYAADDDSETGMDVTISAKTDDGEDPEDDKKLGSSGGGCDNGSGALSAIALLFAALKRKDS